MKHSLLLGLLAFALVQPSPSCAQRYDTEAVYDGKSESELLKLADAGDPKAQFTLGLKYDTETSYQFGWQERAFYYKRALIFYRKAADQGHIDAMANLASIYRDGEVAHLFSDAEARSLGIEHDAALFWFRKAAELGNAYAQNNLGALYLKGEGVTKDDAIAVSWFHKAAEQGFADGQFNLGVMYFNGTGVTKDAGIAINWWHKAADKGLYAAQRKLGLLYETGTGVTKDYVQALKWLTLASWQGINVTDRHKDELKIKMTSDQIAKANKLANEWVKK